VFGFLLTLTVPLLVLFYRAHRLLLAYASCHVGVVFWFWTFHQDRYLQAQLPLMASAVAAMLCAIWQMGLLPRLAAAVLLVLQVAWGGDVPFFPTHAMVGGGSAIKSAVDLLASGFNNQRTKRLEVFGTNQEVTRALPKNATLLIHEMPDHLGLGVRTVSDLFQTQIDYSVAPSPAGVYELLRSLGVTHVLAPSGSSKGADTVGGDVAFHYFMTNGAQHKEHHGGSLLAALPAAKPSDAGFHDRVLYLGCNDAYAHGVYAISAMNVPVDWNTPQRPKHYPPPLQRVERNGDVSRLLDQVDAVVLGTKCFKAPVPLAQHGFTQAARRREDAIWVRNRAP
jgi:hypothetical protein